MLDLGVTGHKADVIQKIISWLKWFPVWQQGVQKEERREKKWDKNKGLSIRHAQQLTQSLEQHYLFIKKSQRRLEETWHNMLPMKTLDSHLDVSHLNHDTIKHAG